MDVFDAFIERQRIVRETLDEANERARFALAQGTVRDKQNAYDELERTAQEARLMQVEAQTVMEELLERLNAELAKLRDVL